MHDRSDIIYAHPFIRWSSILGDGTSRKQAHTHTPTTPGHSRVSSLYLPLYCTWSILPSTPHTLPSDCGPTYRTFQQNNCRSNVHRRHIYEPSSRDDVIVSRLPLAVVGVAVKKCSIPMYELLICCHPAGRSYLDRRTILTDVVQRLQALRRLV